MGWSWPVHDYSLFCKIDVLSVRVEDDKILDGGEVYLLE
jgi:hypothetical protein